jgi:prevent-host-death family protein
VGLRRAVTFGVALRNRYSCAMSVEIRQSDLRNDNAAVMRRVAEGESFVVTVNGRAVADVVPHTKGTGRRRYVPVLELAEAFAAEPVPDPAAWRADLSAADEFFGLDEIVDPFASDTQ